MTTKIEIARDNGQWWPAMSPVNKVISAIGEKCDGAAVGESEVGSDVLVEFGATCETNRADVLLVKWSEPNCFASIWSSTWYSHWLTSRDPKTRLFISIRVDSLEHAYQVVSEMKAKGHDVYYSTSEFNAEAKTRKSVDVACVRGFWLDIDVGLSKASQGQGYATVTEAKAAIKALRIATGLPIPTHVVSSGNGLHVYWIVDSHIDPAHWIEHARMLKGLTKTLGLLADPTRTADIASLMRVPGTSNYKDPANPKSVELIYAGDTLIEKAVMLEAIEKAHKAHCIAAHPQTPALMKMHARQASILPVQLLQVPSVFTRLVSALTVVSPDCDEATWSLKILAPMAHAARDNPEHAIFLCNLARCWSSGTLRGLPCEAWTTPGGNRLTGSQYFERQWQRFVTDNYVGGYTLETICALARSAGWLE